MKKFTQDVQVAQLRTKKMKTFTQQVVHLTLRQDVQVALHWLHKMRKFERDVQVAYLWVSFTEDVIVGADPLRQPINPGMQ